MPRTADRSPARPVERARFADLSPRRVHALLQLRSAVFVVEQDCPFLDADDRDHEPATEHLWIDDRSGLAACARLLREDGGRWHLGRICTRADVRSQGLAAALVGAGLDRARELGARTVLIGAQAQLRGWYESLGFARCGPRYLEDGILHWPMSQELEAAP